MGCRPISPFCGDGKKNGNDRMGMGGNGNSALLENSHFGDLELPLLYIYILQFAVCVSQFTELSALYLSFFSGTGREGIGSRIQT